DPDVEPEGPVVDIIFVQLDPPLGPLDGPHFTAQPLHLGIAGNPRLDPVAPGIAAHGFVIEAIADHHLGAVGTRTDEGHAALDDVEQLRQLVDAEAAQEASDRSYAWVAARRCLLGADIGHVRVHGSELEDVD